MLTSMYEGRYFSFTTGPSSNVGSSGCNIISTISPWAPFVTLKSVWMLDVTITFMPTTTSTVAGNHLTFIVVCHPPVFHFLLLHHNALPSWVFFHQCSPLQYILRVLFSCLDNAYGLICHSIAFKLCVLGWQWGIISCFMADKVLLRLHRWLVGIGESHHRKWQWCLWRNHYLQLHQFPPFLSQCDKTTWPEMSLRS